MSSLQKHVNESEKQVSLRLSGEMNLSNAHELKEILKEYLSETRKIRISIEKAETFDLSAVQLVYAFQRDRQKNGLETLFETDFSQSTATLLKHSSIIFLDKE
jgi:anti-anti-sigma factor